MTSRRLRKDPNNSLSRRKSNRPGSRPGPKISDRVEIWWEADETYYRGTITQQLKAKSFRILYDDGETEDLDFTQEDWRFAVDTSAQPTIPTRPSSDVGVVEVVLDGSADAPGMEHAPSTVVQGIPRHPALGKTLSQTDYRKGDHAASARPPFSTDPANSPKSTADSRKRHATSDREKKTTTPKNTDRTAPVIKTEPSISATPSSSIKSPSAKARARQKFARVRKEASSGSVSKAKQRKTSSGAPEIAAPGAKVKAQALTPSQEMDTSEATNGRRPMSAKQLASTAPDDVGKVVTRVEKEENPSKIAAAASLLAISKPTQPADVSAQPCIVVPEKGSRKEHMHSSNQSDKAAEEEGQGKDNPMAASLSSHKEIPKATGASLPSDLGNRFNLKPDATTPKDQSVAHEKTGSKSRQGLGTAPSAGGGGEDRRASQSSTVSPAHCVPVTSSHSIVERPSGEETAPQAKSTLLTGVPKNTSSTIVDTGTSIMKVTRKEDSYRSRSSSERPTTSTNREKRKKRKKASSGSKSNGPERVSTVHPPSMDQSNGKVGALHPQPETAHTATKDADRREVSRLETGKSLPHSLETGTDAGAPVRAKLALKGKALDTDQGNALTHSKAEIITREADHSTQAANHNPGHAASKVLSHARAATALPESRLQTKVAEKSPAVGALSGIEGNMPSRDKRQRGEHGHVSQSTKRARTQISGDRASVPKTQGHGKDVQADSSAGRHDMAELGRILKSSVTEQLETVSRDVKGLVSMSLKFRQDAEFYKDVVHRSVVEEGTKMRGMLQDLREELFTAIEDQARQAEYSITRRIHEAFASFSAYDRGNGLGSTDHHNTFVARQPSAAGRSVNRVPPVAQQALGRGDTIYASPDDRMVRNIPRPTDHISRTENVNAHSDSPTAIANVNRGPAGDGRSRGQNGHEAGKESEDGLKLGELRARVSHLVARQVTVWLLETPHEYNPRDGSVTAWAHRTATSTFEKVAVRLSQFGSFMQAYQILCSSLGNDAVELQWFVSPGGNEHLRRARRNYAAWDPPPSDEEWTAEMSLLREIAERFDRAMEKYNCRDKTMIEVCAEVSQLAAADGTDVAYQTTNGRPN